MIIVDSLLRCGDSCSTICCYIFICSLMPDYTLVVCYLLGMLFVFLIVTVTFVILLPGVVPFDYCYCCILRSCIWFVDCTVVVSSCVPVLVLLLLFAIIVTLVCTAYWSWPSLCVTLLCPIDCFLCLHSCSVLVLCVRHCVFCYSVCPRL